MSAKGDLKTQLSFILYQDRLFTFVPVRLHLPMWMGQAWS